MLRALRFVVSWISWTEARYAWSFLNPAHRMHSSRKSFESHQMADRWARYTHTSSLTIRRLIYNNMFKFHVKGAPDTSPDGTRNKAYWTSCIFHFYYVSVIIVIHAHLRWIESGKFDPCSEFELLGIVTVGQLCQLGRPKITNSYILSIVYSCGAASPEFKASLCVEFLKNSSLVTLQGIGLSPKLEKGKAVRKRNATPPQLHHLW